MRFQAPAIFSVWATSTKFCYIAFSEPCKLQSYIFPCFKWSYLLSSMFSTTDHKTNNCRPPEDYYFCLCTFLVTYLEPLYLLSTETSCLYSPRLKLQRYTVTQFSILLWTFKAVQISHFSLKLFKIILYSVTCICICTVSTLMLK